MISEAADVNRNTGRTFRQLQRMKDKGLFLAVSGQMSYVAEMCCKIGGCFNHAQRTWFRDDGAVIHVEPADVLRRPERPYGLQFSEIVVDHSVRFDPEMREGFAQLRHAVNLD